MTTLNSPSKTTPPTLSSAALIAGDPNACEDEPGYVNRGDLPYSYEDIGLNAQGLQAKFADAGEHEHHTRALWQSAVDNDATTQGYWEWVLGSIAEDDDIY